MVEGLGIGGGEGRGRAGGGEVGRNEIKYNNPTDTQQEVNIFHYFEK